jgi:hypothetical protein
MGYLDLSRMVANGSANFGGGALYLTDDYAEQASAWCPWRIRSYAAIGI